MAECLRQIVPNRWTSVRKSSFTKCLCLHEGGPRFVCRMIVIVLLEYKVEGERADTERDVCVCMAVRTSMSVRVSTCVCSISLFTRHVL